MGQQPSEPDGRGTTPVLSCQGLERAFGDRRAVADLSFDVHPGEAYGLLGPNGAGKTTTIRMVCGILEPDAGTVRIGGGTVTADDHRVRGALGYVPQGLALFPDLTIVENLRFWARLYGVPRRRRKARMADVLELVQLGDRAGDRVEHCSGGMQRRLNLAIALLHEPRLLVLDEPTVGVDAQSRNSLLTTLAHLRDDGAAILYTSHYMDEVQRLCDRVGIVDQGRLLVEGPPDTLVAANGAAADLEGLFLELTGNALRD